jgi:Flp pilus assembly protein TadB
VHEKGRETGRDGRLEQSPVAELKTTCEKRRANLLKGLLAFCILSAAATSAGWVLAAYLWALWHADLVLIAYLLVLILAGMIGRASSLVRHMTNESSCNDAYKVKPGDACARLKNKWP